MSTLTFTKTAPPDWLLTLWQDIDGKTFGAGFDCLAENVQCDLGVAHWHGREEVRAQLRAATEKNQLTQRHRIAEYWDSPALKVAIGEVDVCFGGPNPGAVQPMMIHFFYMDEADPTRVTRWLGAVGPASF